MSESKDKSAGAADPPQADETPTEGKRSGRVAFDARNNPIWEWQLETGVYSRDVTTQKLKKLDLGDLSIAETGIQRRPPGLGESDDQGRKSGQLPPVLPGGGFNPYDNSSRPARTSNPYDKARALANKVSASPAANPAPAKRPIAPRQPAPVAAPKPSALDKLGKWFRGKRKPEDDYE